MADPRALLQKADKAAQGATGGFSLFGGRTEKWENAADLFTQAANAFRVQKQSKPIDHTNDEIETLTHVAQRQTMRQAKHSRKPQTSNRPN